VSEPTIKIKAKFPKLLWSIVEEIWENKIQPEDDFTEPKDILQYIVFTYVLANREFYPSGIEKCPICRAFAFDCEGHPTSEWLQHQEMEAIKQRHEERNK